MRRNTRGFEYNNGLFKSMEKMQSLTCLCQVISVKQKI
jgi:hypothetical protein